MKSKLESFLHIVHEPGDYVKPQLHQIYEVVYYEKGSGKTTIDGEVYHFSENNIAVIAPRTVHDEESIDRTEVMFCLFSVEDDEDKLSLRSGIISDDGLYVQEIHDLLSTIKNEMQNKFESYEQYLNLVMGQIVIKLLRIQHGHRTDKITDGIEYTRTFLKENYSNEIDFCILAENIGYSYDRFRHIFKEEMDLSPAQYLMNIRIAKAKEFLENTDYPIKNIARLCGFNNHTKFTEIFREKTSFTPTHYRRLMQNNGEPVLNFEGV